MALDGRMDVLVLRLRAEVAVAHPPRHVSERILDERQLGIREKACLRQNASMGSCLLNVIRGKAPIEVH